MPKFANSRTRAQTPDSTNLAGGASYSVADEKKALASVILSAMLKGDSYYRSDSETMQDIFNLVNDMQDMSFVAKAMVYVRNEGNLRSVSHLLANAIAENNDGSFPFRSALRKAIVRPDDMIEIAALWKSRHSTMIPNAMRRAFKDLLDGNKWDAYQLNKYRREGQNFKLKDVIKLVHPVDEHGNYKKIIESKSLSAPRTVEQELSSGKSASLTFSEMLDKKRLGYMVAIKNIRNALESGLSEESLGKWCELVSNKKAVEKSRVLPFRLVDAWDAVKDLPMDTFTKRKVKQALNMALTHSATNIGLASTKEKIALVLDESGSMGMHSNNGVTAWKHAIILASTLYAGLPKDNVVVYFFSSSCREVDFRGMEPLDIVDSFSPNMGATYFDAPLKSMVNSHTSVDKIVMFTDMQLYNNFNNRADSFTEYLKMYRALVNPNVSLLFWNLASYNSGTPLELKNDVFLASGFSDKLLKVIPKLWRDQNALVKDIEAINI